MICRLCHSEEVSITRNSVDTRIYFLCHKCSLITTDEKHFPGREEEKARYLTHQNGLHSEGYVKFLYQAIDPALSFLNKDMAGLDYGCGHTPTLSRLLGSKGYQCEDYDPFFIDHRLDKKFDFIFSTEVFEHFFYPSEEIEKIKKLLMENGILVIMTERWKDPDHFSKWCYTRDATHISFFHSGTFDFICSHFGFRKIFDDSERVIILQNEMKVQY